MDEDNFVDTHGGTDVDKIYYNYIKNRDMFMYKPIRETDVYHDYLLNGFYMFFQRFQLDIIVDQIDTSV